MMAEAAVDSVDCLLCSEECVEPLTLGCEHRFCSHCLREHWAPSLTGDCPTCKRRASNDRPLETDNLSQRQTSQTGETRKRPEQTPEFPSDEPSMSQGVTSEEESRERLQSEINKLKEKKERTEDVMKQYKSMLEYTEGKCLQWEAQIRAQFRCFHEFLFQEEELHLSDLRKEQQEKTQIIEEELKKVNTESSSLKGHMENLVLTDEEPQLRSPLIDQARVLGNLGFRVWEKMGTIVSYSPVLLDPNTAHRELCVSEDLTSVRQRETLQEVPLNPERFTNHSFVLGNKGFRFLSDWWWDVEVGDHPNWSIGVVSEYADRRARYEASSDNDFWCLTYRDNKYTDVNGETLDLKRCPETIRVYWLKYGSIFFYDTEDLFLIFRHKVYGTDDMIPCFSVGGADQTKDIKISTYKPVVKVSGQEYPPLD